MEIRASGTGVRLVPLTLCVSSRTSPRMSVTTLLFALGGILLSAALICLALTLRIDRQLQELIPRATEKRWRDELIRDIHLYRPDFAGLESMDVSLTPLRWRRDYHGVKGIKLLERFFLAVSGMAVATTLAIMAIGAALHG